MSRFQFPPPAPTTFPIAATAITDNFQRANENPIGAPWVTGADFSTDAAQIRSQQFSNVDTGPGTWYGGAYYGSQSYQDYEMIAAVSVSLSAIGSSGVYLGTNYSDNGVGRDSVALQGNLISVTGGIRGGSTEYSEMAISQAAGDRIGIRCIGSSVFCFYLPVGSSAWQSVGNVARSVHSSVPWLYVQGNDAYVTVSEFRVAEVGQLIPQHPVSGSGRNSW